MTAIAHYAVTCPAVPVQIEGATTDGRWFYFRCRGEHAWLGLGTTPGQAVEDSLDHARQITDRPFAAGMLPLPEALALLGEMLAERAS